MRTRSGRAFANSLVQSTFTYSISFYLRGKSKADDKGELSTPDRNLMAVGAIKCKPMFGAAVSITVRALLQHGHSLPWAFVWCIVGVRKIIATNCAAHTIREIEIQRKICGGEKCTAVRLAQMRSGTGDRRKSSKSVGFRIQNEKGL